MAAQFDNVSVIKQGNVFFDGKCVSHTVVLADGTKKTVGVILPSTLTFNTSAREIMEIVAGSCRVSVAGGSVTQYGPGQTFEVQAQSSFTIEAAEAVHYVCHFG